ncbi:MAG: hypothetical protein KME31_34460 [Tolypothrix carrinoi HA7290-LM1]|nr:hypothetical protein [Tolypothrix carrinoi HA7290-LM1]
MGNGQWAMGNGNKAKFRSMPTWTLAPCPMTAGATTEGTSATHCLPHAP